MPAWRWLVCSVCLAVLPVACGEEETTSLGDTASDTGTMSGSETESDVESSSDKDRDPDLALGEVLEVLGGSDGSFTFELYPAEAQERYVLQLVSRSRIPAAEHEYEVAIDGEVLGSPERTEPIENESLVLRHASGKFLDHAIAAARRGGKLPSPVPALPPAVGDTLVFEIADSASSYVEVEAEVMSVSGELVIAFDRTTDSNLQIGADILADVAQSFAEVVLPRERRYFGQESDVNEDGHVTVLFSPLVYTATDGAMAYVAPCDLLAEGSEGCAASNEQELIYVSPPDLLPSHMATAKALTETMAHEFQHAIYFYRKFMLNDATDENESVYITEGMSALAQDLSGFQAGNRYVAGTAIPAVNDFSLTDVFADSFGYDPAHDGVYRGAAYLVLRYAFDRLGGESITADGELVDHGGIAFVQAMANSNVFGLAGFEDAAGVEADQLFPDFYMAMLLDDRTSEGLPLSVDPRYCFADPWEDPVTGNPRGITMSFDLAGGTWKVRGVSLQKGGADGVIRSGGVEYLLVEPDSEQDTVNVKISADKGARLDVRVVRI